MKIKQQFYSVVNAAGVSFLFSIHFVFTYFVACSLTSRETEEEEGEQKNTTLFTYTKAAHTSKTQNTELKIRSFSLKIMIIIFFFTHIHSKWNFIRFSLHFTRAETCVSLFYDCGNNSNCRNGNVCDCTNRFTRPSRQTYWIIDTTKIKMSFVCYFFRSFRVHSLTEKKILHTHRRYFVFTRWILCVCEWVKENWIYYFKTMTIETR